MKKRQAKKIMRAHHAEGREVTRRRLQKAAGKTIKVERRSARKKARTTGRRAKGTKR